MERHRAKPIIWRAANDIFWISGWIFVVLVASVWFAGKPAVSGPVAAH